MPSFATMACERSPAPFEVPPESTTMSLSFKRLAHRFLQHRRVVGKGAEDDRLAAGFGNGGGDDGAVAVVDACRP